METGTSNTIKLDSFVTNEQILNQVTGVYLSSVDYNGISVSRLAESCSQSRVKKCLKDLVTAGLVSINYTDRHPNAHIKAFEAGPLDEQIARMSTEAFATACVYPTSRHLQTKIDPTKYLDRPFELCLLLGAGQLTYKSFDLSVMDMYRNNPRYQNTNNDIGGRITVKRRYRDNSKIKVAKQDFMKSYGFCYDKDYNVYVAVMLRYLARLSPKHQLMWASKLMYDGTRLHPNYYTSQKVGVQESEAIDIKTKK